MSAIIRRVTLAPATLTPVTKPASVNAHQVEVSNSTGSVLFVYSGDTPVEDVDNFLKIPIGQEHLLRYRVINQDDVLFYLKSAAGGEVVLIWG